MVHCCRALKCVRLMHRDVVSAMESSRADSLVGGDRITRERRVARHCTGADCARRRSKFVIGLLQASSLLRQAIPILYEKR